MLVVIMFVDLLCPLEVSFSGITLIPTLTGGGVVSYFHIYCCEHRYLVDLFRLHPHFPIIAEMLTKYAFYCCIAGSL